MRLQLTLLLFVLPLFVFAQEDASWKNGSLVFTPEILIGKTAEANENFPDRKLQKQLVFSIGRFQDNNPQEWAQRLEGLKTGVGFGVTDFGNIDSLGLAFSVMPYVEFGVFKSKRLKLLLGGGASYFTEKFDPVTNPNNQAVTTDITWAFRAYLNYHLLTTSNIDWRLGVGVAHHSNGHTRLLNQGYNSFLVSVSGDIRDPLKQSQGDITTNRPPLKRSVYSYLQLRGGLGENVLSTAYNDKRRVYTLSGEYGKVYNNLFRLGLGFNYRLYEHYYDYIKDNEFLVRDGEEFAHFSKSPWRYGTSFTLTITGEYLLNHFGINFQIGYNLHKPAYKIDWRINQGWDATPREIPDYWQLGEFDSKYKAKQRISTRIGMRYYLIGTSKAPTSNIFAGAHINSNLGQADFTEFSLGYVYSFNFKER